MSSPDPFPCGGRGQKPCPPQPAAVTTEPVQYTLTDMHEYGQLCYTKGRVDELMVPHPGDIDPTDPNLEGRN